MPIPPLFPVQVYVRNLPFAATEQDIDHFFSQAGHVEDVRRGAGPDGTSASHPGCPSMSSLTMRWSTKLPLRFLVGAA